MSDISSNGGPAKDPASSGVVPSWQNSATLDALDEMVQLATQVPLWVARRSGHSASELHALRHLSNQPLGPVELARLLGVTSAASSGIVDRLVQHGHVERQPHPEDGRRTQVVLTDAGRTEVFRTLAPMFVGLAEVDTALTDSERVVIERYLRGVSAAMRSVM